MAVNAPTFVIPQKRGALALDDLERVEWDGLRHARGVGRAESEAWNPFTKTNVKVRFAGIDALFRDLVSDDEELREMATNDLLFDALTHQSDLFEVSAYAIPFLAALAADAQLPRRREVLDSLSSMVLSAAFDSKEPTGANVLHAFHQSKTWMQEVAQAGPPGVTKIVELLDARTQSDPPGSAPTGYAHEVLLRDTDQIQEWLTEAFGPSDFLG